MPERFARLAALALIVILIVALPLLVSLFGGLGTPAVTRTPTLGIAVASAATEPATNTPTGIPTNTPTETAPPPTETTPPTLTPTTSPTPGCPIPATPEPLWVNPVLSPTNALSQKISVTLGRGREISVSSEAGSFTQQGEFSTARTVEFEIPLVPNATNNLLVTGKVEYAPGCSYTLQTRVDRVGNPLVILQTSAQNPPTPFISPTPPPPGTVYLRPFSQVFAMNQDTPSPADKLWLYEADPNAAFRVLTQEGAFTHLLSQGGTLNFWTLNDNIVPTPAPPPRYDNSLAGRRVEFASATVFACEGQYPRNLILGFCAEIPATINGEIIQRVQVDTSMLYMVRVNNKLYWVSSNVLKQEPQ